MKKIELKERGITLITLVITIIVLLILAGVTIATLMGDNGILTKASEADLETRAATVEERKDLWKTEKQTDNYVGENTAQTLEELLDDLEGEELITAEERTQIEETGHVIIGSKDISFSDGLTEASYTITSSLDEVNFNKIVTEGDIAVEKPGYTSYTIDGVSASQDGEYVTSGSVEGKSGNLEIIGDINDATFSYTLTDFMQGDETFYCKINIDGEEYYKVINVIQGDSIIYEEDFVGIEIPDEYGEYCEIVEDERFSGGKAIKFEGQGFDYPAFQFDLVCTRINLLTMIPVVESTINTSKAANSINTRGYSDPEKVNRVEVNTKIYAIAGTTAEWNVNDLLIEFDEPGKYYIETYVLEPFFNTQYPVFDRGNEFYLDALEVLK